VLYLEHSFVWCWNLDSSKGRSETPGKFWYVVLEKDGDDQLDQLCEKWRSIPQTEGGMEHPIYDIWKEG
jgi:hypothetical protein